MILDTGPEMIFEGILFTREEEIFSGGISSKSGSLGHLKRNTVPEFL